VVLLKTRTRVTSSHTNNKKQHVWSMGFVCGVVEDENEDDIITHKQQKTTFGVWDFCMVLLKTRTRVTSSHTNNKKQHVWSMGFVYGVVEDETRRDESVPSDIRALKIDR
jgi:hypothetical protein